MVGKQPKRKARPGVDEYGRTPLHYAASDGNASLCVELLTAGADPNATDDNGWAPLHFAAQVQSAEVTELLLGAAANTELRDSYGNTPLWRATMTARGNGDVIALLRRAGADPYAKNNYGNSPISIACETPTAQGRDASVDRGCVSGPDDSSVGGDYMKYRFILALLSLPGLANAGVTYQMTTQSFGRLAGGPSSSDYVVEGDKIRINASDGKTVFIFRDESSYVIDSVSRSAQVLRHATLEESARQLNESVKRLEALAASAAPDRRAMAEQAAAMTKDIEERQRRPMTRDYRMTDRMEKSEGRACHLWEEWEQDAKRLELCVVPALALPGGADVLVGMKSLSPYLHGSVFAVGVEFGPVSGWSGIEGLGGVPVIVREFQGGQLVRETRLTRFRADEFKVSAFEVPEGYPVQEGPGRK